MNFLLRSMGICLAMCWLAIAGHAQSLTTPEEFLGYKVGEKYTYHHRIVDYFERIAGESDQVRLIPYGTSHEGRPLMVAVLSAAENLENMDAIRLANLSQTGLSEESSTATQLPIVWMSYTVHGNEASCSEAVLETFYQLASGKTAGATDWLKEMVVVIDPCLNPDGRDRYTNWYNQYQSAIANANPIGYEHDEPWPGGRVNHYLFDLNRDWAWQTQHESRQRIRLIQQWMPHIHVDFHEMGANSPYYFAPAAKPYHESITAWQREFQTYVGKNHAKYFDKEGWRYFTKEVFDLLYPSYGDTWPTFNGAIGFTYEQGGGSRAGVAISLNSGATLTLRDRVDHHVTTGLSSVEVAYTYRKRLLEEFNAYFESAQKNPEGTYKSYVIPQRNNKDRIAALKDLLDKQQISYGYASADSRGFKGFDYQQRKDVSYTISKGDLIISAYQPMGRMVKVLFEPETYLEDSVTYDLTAWSLPYVYGVEAYASTEKIATSTEAPTSSVSEMATAIESPYAYFCRWGDVADLQFLAAALREGLKVRYAETPFSIEGNSFDRGTLLILRNDNQQDDFDSQVRGLAETHGRQLLSSATGFVSEGGDFGAYSYPFIGRKNIALVGGEGTRSYSLGEIWHYFEQVLEYPVTMISNSSLPRVNLSAFDVLILGSGSYGAAQEAILDYVRGGGKVIALESAMRIFTQGNDKEGYDSELGAAIAAKAMADSEQADADGEEALETLIRYEEEDRESISDYVAGSIYRVDLDDSHPISFGLGTQMHLMKRNSSVYPYLPEGAWNVGIYKGDAHVSGFTGARLKRRLKNSLAIGAESMGRGTVIYFTDSPIFRAFWHQGKLVLGNAIFFYE